MTSGWDLSGWIIGFALTAAGILVPIVLAILLAVWLINKKRRDDLMIERLVQIKQTLEEVRDRLGRSTDKSQ
jgi:chromate transport protein ChrA